MSLSIAELKRDFQITEPDASDVAVQWTKQAKKLKKKDVPAAADLATMITGIGLDLTMQGAPQIEIDLLDPVWNLMDSGFFDCDANGRLDDVRINYPQGSKYWWCLFQYTPKADGSVQTYWIPRVVRDLTRLYGPLKANRAKRTRAEFLKMCVDKIEYAHFYSKQLHTKQPIAPLQLSASESNVTTESTTSGHKTVGLKTSSKKLHLTVKGAPASAAQIAAGHKLIQVCDQLKAPHAAAVAIIFAAIWESGMTEGSPPNSLGYCGILAGSDRRYSPNDTVKQATDFLKGGAGYGGGSGIGAIQRSQQTGNPVEIAVRTEVPSIWPDNAYTHETGYPGNNGAIAEASKWVEAGGGASGAGGVITEQTEKVQQYNFTIGTTDDPHEDYWTGMNRLAQEVQWELVVDGDDVYYDSDVTLCRMAIEDVIDRNDEAVTDWTYDWDNGGIVSNFQLTIQCDLFDFRPADVLKLTRFGPASTGSTIKLPGRWLVGEIQRSAGNIVSTLTLVQPKQQLPEPAPQVVTSTSVKAGSLDSINLGNASPKTVVAAVAAAQALSKKMLPYDQGHRILTHSAPNPPEGYDCSAGVSWVLLTAGFSLPAGISWGGWAPVSGAFESWGDPGRGKQMTVWANADHIFIEFNVPGIGHVGFDSGHPSSSGVWFQTSFRDTGYTSSGAFVPRHWPGT